MRTASILAGVVLGSLCAWSARPAPDAPGASQGATAPAAAAPGTAERYPPRRHPSALRFYAVEGNVALERLRKAVVELDPPGRIVCGPIASKTRPDKFFLMVEVPAKDTAKDVLKALRKGCSKAEALAATTFRCTNEPLPDLLGNTPLDCVLGMAGDLRWFEQGAETRAFYYVPGKLEARELASRFEKLYGPFGHGAVGQLIEEEFTWPLEKPIDAGSARKAEKAIAKLPGVRRAAIDVEHCRLTVAVAIDELRVALPETTAPAPVPQEREELPRLRYDTNAVLDALEEHQIAAEVPKSEEPGAR